MTDTTVARPEPHTIEHWFVTVGNKRVRIAATRPDGAHPVPLLVFNGIGAGVEILEPLMRRMTGFRVIAFDLPGVGASEPSSPLRRFSGFAKFATDVLDQLEIDSVFAMGISWGGGLAQQFAHQFPGRCKRLVLVSTSTGHLMVPPSPRVMLRMSTPLRYLSAGYFRRIAGEIYGGDFRSDAELAEHYARRMAPPSLRGYLSQLSAIAGWTSLCWAHRISQPTLVMAGEDDPIVPVVNARILCRLIPGAELEVFDCGHLFLLTRLERSVATLERFLGAP